MRQILFFAAVLFCPLLGAQTGPGGVGNSANNALWLDATLLTGFSNGDAVATWPDVSGNGFVATTTIAGREPSYSATGLGGRAGVVFNRNNDDFMLIPHDAAFNRTTGGFYAAVITRGSTAAPDAQGVICKRNNFNSKNHFGLLFNSNFRFDANGTNIGGSGGNGAVATGAGAVLSGSVNGTASSSVLNGAQRAAGAAGATPSPNDADVCIGTLISSGAPSTAQDFDGTIHEILVYNTYVNDAQRLILSNYLGAKYGVGLGIATRFSNYAYGNEVAGIGRATSGEEHLLARGTGILEVTGAGLSNDTWLLWGHNNQPLTQLATPAAGIAQQLNRTWLFTETGSVPAATVAIDQATLESLFPRFALGGLALVVSADATFDGADAFYPLTLSGGSYTATMDFSASGDSYVTLVQRGFIIHEAGNWKGGLLAGKPDVAQATDHGKPMIIADSAWLDVPARIDNLTIETGQVLAVAGGNYLQVDGTATNAGLLRLQATSGTNYAQYQGPSLNDVYLQVYLAGSGWHNMAFPFASTTLADLAAANPTGRVNYTTFPNVYAYNANNCGGINIGLGSTHAWGTWEQLNNGAAVFSGQGYNFYSHPFYGNANAALNIPGTTIDPATPINYPVLANYGGWNMIPNPYTASVDWLGFLSTNSAADVDPFMYVWDPITMQYRVTDDNGIGVNGGNDFLAPGQSMWLRHTSGVLAGTTCTDFASAASTTVAFQGSHRDATEQPLFTKGSKPVGSTKLRVVSPQTGRTDEVSLQFDPSWSNDFVPGEDGLKFFGFSPNLFAVQGPQQLVFARYNTVVDSIMLGVHSTDGDTLTLEVVSSNLGLGDFLLEDLMLDIASDFNSGAYTFVYDEDFGFNRFVLHIVPYANIGSDEQEAQQVKTWLTNQTLYVSMEENTSASQLTVLDLSGREVMRLNGPLSGLQKIPFTAPAGMYLVAVSTGGQQQVFKVVQP